VVGALEMQRKADLLGSSSRGCKYCVTILDGICKFYPGWREPEAKEGEPLFLTLSGGFRRGLAVSLWGRPDRFLDRART
jgi:hypothetical protein